jgi:hypothetical protein
MPNVLVVPVYVEVPSGFERSVMALESHLRRAGYVFHTGDPLFETLEDTKKNLRRASGDAREGELDGARPLELVGSNKA